MPHVDRCFDCEVRLEFVRSWKGGVEGEDKTYDFETWACRSCGRERVMFAMDWPPWFTRSFEEEAQWLRENRWGGPELSEINKMIKKGQYVPPAERAGTKLDHKSGQVRKVFEKRNGKKIEVGSIDASQRVYQMGSTKRPGHTNKKEGLSGLVYWKLRVVGFGLGEWEEVSTCGDVDFIEVVDMGAGKCYRVSLETAKAIGYEYTGERGPRYGIALEEFDVYDTKWSLLVEGSSKKPRRGTKRQVAGQMAIDVDSLPF